MQSAKGLAIGACILALLLGIVGVARWRQHRHRRHLLREAVVVDSQGRACYLDHHNHRIYYYHTSDGDFYSPPDYSRTSPGRISLPPGGRFEGAPASETEQAFVEALESLAEEMHSDIEETVDATEEQIGAWENEGGAIVDESASGDEGGDAGDAADSGDGGGDGGGGDGGGDGD
ncbi:MAG TPA: hypothetical protein VHM90_17845 [Phycisphaerae bacterium]|jgi:hypothetical protein|nr:hypothetical protein [Phycisphaerae bacterium]